jgi:DNA-binding PadR family transcriptional regulator
MRYLKLTPIVAACSTALMLLAACGAEPGNTTKRETEPSSPPVDAAVVRDDVERSESFDEPRQAACPRRIPDRIEERRPFPAIDILEGLGYVTISDDSSRGAYEKVIELTPAGEQELGDDVEEEADRYVVTVARREYLPGSERYATAPGGDDRVVVSFMWKWQPTNSLGERMTLGEPGGRDERQGRATYRRTTEGWELEEVWLESDARDYVRGVYR